jgi:hypothetical protein
MARRVTYHCDNCGNQTQDTTGWIELHQFTVVRPKFYSFPSETLFQQIGKEITEGEGETRRVRLFSQTAVVPLL